jgi:hypothetical protein
MFDFIADALHSLIHHASTSTDLHHALTDHTSTATDLHSSTIADHASTAASSMHSHSPLFGSYGGYPTKDEYDAAWARFERSLNK